jgi:DNA invertase Pin-like site-specific DNA recombinase
MACLKALQPGNAPVVWKLDRLGRDLKHMVNTIDDLNRRDAGLKVLTDAGEQIDTTSAAFEAEPGQSHGLVDQWVTVHNRLPLSHAIH